MRCAVHKCAWRGGVRSCPHGADVDGRAEGAHREAGAAGGGPAPGGAAPLSAPLHPQGPQGKSTQAHEHSPRQVSWAVLAVLYHMRIQLDYIFFIAR